MNINHAENAKMYRCKKCGQIYPIVPYFKHAAPHGPNENCTSEEWELVENDDT